MAWVTVFPDPYSLLERVMEEPRASARAVAQSPVVRRIRYALPETRNYPPFPNNFAPRILNFAFPTQQFPHGKSPHALNSLLASSYSTRSSRPNKTPAHSRRRGRWPTKLSPTFCELAMFSVARRAGRRDAARLLSPLRWAREPRPLLARRAPKHERRWHGQVEFRLSVFFCPVTPRSCRSSSRTTYDLGAANL